jgi:hypothetical protein
LPRISGRRRQPAFHPDGSQQVCTDGRQRVLVAEHLTTLRSAYLRSAQDAIRHDDEQAVEGFSQQIALAGGLFHREPVGGEAIPNGGRVLSASPDFPKQLRQAVEEDLQEFAGISPMSRC